MAYTAPSITASGTTFAQFQAGGASGHLEKLIAAQGTTLAPTLAPTLAASGTGNSLAASTYYVVFTESNGVGETTASPVSSSQVVTSGQLLAVTFPPLKPGNVSRNLYLGFANTGPFTLYATGIAISPYNCTAAAPSNSFAVTPPTVNTTGLTYTDANGNVAKTALQLIRSAKDGNLEDLYRYLRAVVEEFNSGQPSSFPALLQKFHHAHIAFAMLSTLCSEMGTLIDANAGTLGTTATGIGGRKVVRTWP